MRFLLPLLAATCTIALGQDQPAKVDRSAEPALREVFKAMGELRDVKLSVVRYEMESDSDQVSEGSWFDIWYRGPGEFRVESTEVMGGQSAFVADGTAMLRWGGGDTMRLVDAPKQIGDAGMDVRSSVSFLFLLLDGEERFSKIVSESGRIVKLSDENGLQRIEFVATNVGTLRLGFDPSTKIAMFAMTVRPRGGGTPFGGSSVTLDRLVNIDHRARVDKRRLSTMAPDGFTVRDERKAKPDGTGHAERPVAN